MHLSLWYAPPGHTWGGGVNENISPAQLLLGDKILKKNMAIIGLFLPDILSYNV